MQQIYAGIGLFVVRWRWFIVAAWVVITIGSVIAFPSLASVTQNFTLASLLPADAPSVQAAQLARPFQQTQYAQAILVAVRADGALTPADQEAIDSIETQIRALPHVIVVRDLALSPDGSTRQNLIEADVPQDGSGAAATLVTAIRHIANAHDAPSGLAFHLTGPLATTLDTIAALGATQNATANLTYLLIIVLLLVAYRAFLAPLLTLIPAVLVLLLSSPVIAGAVIHLGVRTSVTTQYVLIVLIQGAGTGYGVFLSFRVREELRRGATPHEAVVRAVQSVGEALTFSALTVIAALTTLTVARLGLYQSLGPSLAIAIALMLLAGLTLLPAPPRRSPRSLAG